MAALVSSWSPAVPGAEECFVLVKPEGSANFVGQVASTFEAYDAACAAQGLDSVPGLTATFFLSDSANQEADLRAHPRFARLVEDGVAVTVVQQPPVSGKIALLAYHVRREAGGRRRPLSVGGTKSTAMGVSVATDAYEFKYLKNLLASGGGDAGQQTESLFDTPEGGLRSGGIGWGEVVRTWIYVNDIDNHYPAISAARNRVFARHGVTQDGSGFPASTGIAGRSADHGDLLLLDVLAIKGLQPGQSRRMEATSHMNSTVEYGVTFERGREIVFGDRRHLYISGTASISNEGRILHVGDAARQTERAVENVTALLGASGAELADMRYLLVYLRDMADAAAVTGVLATTALAQVPTLVVHAPVCRPGWLVEVEGVAIDGKGDGRFAPF